MNLIKKLSRIAPFLLCWTVIMSCTTIQESRPFLYNKEVVKKEYGDPSNTTLVFGSVSADVGIFGNILDNIYRLTYIQLNPQKDAMVISPGRVGPTFFTQPLPLGLSLKLAYFYYKPNSQTIIYNYRGVQGKSPIDFRTEKPGLLYLGSFVYCTEEYAKTKKETFSFRYNNRDFYPVGTISELTSLKSILPYYKGTAWEPIILKRIEELSK